MAGGKPLKLTGRIGAGAVRSDGGLAASFGTGGTGVAAATAVGGAGSLPFGAARCAGNRLAIDPRRVGGATATEAGAAAAGGAAGVVAATGGKFATGILMGDGGNRSGRLLAAVGRTVNCANWRSGGVVGPGAGNRPFKLPGWGSDGRACVTGGIAMGGIPIGGPGGCCIGGGCCAVTGSGNGCGNGIGL